MVVPPGGPKTKPNALNVAMGIVARERCEFVTIYDAEDRPEPDQLLKAVGTFRAAPPELACLQAELAFWNDNTNWVTALYWVGYKIHFTRFLPGLARLGLPVPLGGTSNHFRVSALLDVALQPGGQAWDPYNLTEDADLGARLAVGGYRVDLLRSTTMEEAPVRLRVVDKQQRRWKAGYLQTGLVYTRKPVRSMWRMGPVRWLFFNLLMLGVPITFMLNPLFFGLTVVYFTTRWELIAELFPAAIYYPAVVLMLLGNFSVLCELVYTCLREAESARGRFDLARYMLMAPLMWLWMSRSTYIALLELISGKRAWHKTPHGHAEDSASSPGRPALAHQAQDLGWQARPVAARPVSIYPVTSHPATRHRPPGIKVTCSRSGTRWSVGGEGNAGRCVCACGGPGRHALRCAGGAGPAIPPGNDWTTQAAAAPGAVQVAESRPAIDGIPVSKVAAHAGSSVPLSGSIRPDRDLGEHFRGIRCQ